jgi:hypothetical protein
MNSVPALAPTDSPCDLAQTNPCCHHIRHKWMRARPASLLCRGDKQPSKEISFLSVGYIDIGDKIYDAMTSQSSVSQDIGIFERYLR